MISDMPKFAGQYLSTILPPIWQLLTQMADVYIKIIVNETEETPFICNNEGRLLTMNLNIDYRIDYIFRR